MTLHWKKQLFVAEYVAHPELNATEVAKRCGHVGEHVKLRAYEILRDPDVKAAIEEKQRKILGKVDVTVEDVINDIKATRRRCIEEGASAWATQGRLRCDELLGRYLKMWEEPKVGIDVTVDLAERLQKARLQVEGHVVGDGEEPKALPAAKVEVEPMFSRPKVEPARDFCPTGKPAEEPQEYDDWVGRLLP